MIRANSLTKRYGRHLAVDDLSFTVRENRVYGLLGVNGAGKSTTMNIITGYLAPSAGSVEIDDIDMLEKPEKAKAKMGYLPEIPPLYPDMTVREYLCFAAGLRKVKDRNAEASRVIALTGIADVENRLIKNLSKGYKQRVGLAQALVSDPEIIILDEPTVGLDPKQIIEVRELIRELGKSHTVILSSHILSEVQAVCDEILIISKGRLVADGTPEELETMIGGKNVLSLCVKGTSENLKAILEKMELTYEIDTAKSEEGCTGAKVTLTEDEDIREKLFYALADGKLPLMELSVNKVSLEEVFIELTENENLQAANADTGADGEAPPEGQENTSADNIADNKPEEDKDSSDEKGGER